MGGMYPGQIALDGTLTLSSSKLASARQPRRDIRKVTEKAKLNWMKPGTETILTVAEIVRDSAAMNDAALARDFDEARFRAQLVIAKADAAGLEDVVLAGARVLDRLGPPGSAPRKNYGEAMLGLAHVLDAIGFDPL